MNNQSEARIGLFYGISTFIMLGFIPLYFKALENIAPMQMLAARIAWSIPTGLLLVLVAGHWKEVLSTLKKSKTVGWLTLASAFLAGNWLMFIWAVQHERVMELSLGYFINPLFSFILAAIFFNERFSKLQIFAIALASIGVLNQAFVVGEMPWVALTVSVCFGFYGVIRKKVDIESQIGFLIEVIVLFPFAMAYLIYVWSLGAPYLGNTPFESVLVVLSGVVTSVPLVLFALAARRLRLSTVAMLQYLSPTITFIIALYFGEIFSRAHAITFGFIWTGIILFCWVGWRESQNQDDVPLP